MINEKKILICPLDWGLGHATRCVPIIYMLQDSGAKVFIAGGGRALDFLKKEFKDLHFIDFPGYNITYPQKGSMIRHMIMKAPQIFTGIRKEHRQLEKIVQDYGIDLVISDNRFGCWSRKTFSVYITHQLMIKVPKSISFFEYFLHLLHLCFIRKFDRCWVPDLPDKINLSGDLSHKYKLPRNTRFIGPLTRFSLDNPNIDPIDEHENKILAIISGPEPQRSIFQGKVLQQLQLERTGGIILAGMTEKQDIDEPSPDIRILSHADTREIQNMMANARLILCRPGYSTLMDLQVSGKKAVLVPTPGQTEQQYLSEWMEQQGYYVRLEQDQLGKAPLPSDNNLPTPPAILPEMRLLSSAIHDILNKK
ncbi:MAG: glycosyl transferase family 28 [Bacteroidetes bacterium]|nr:glycosyl transferase family 28 [Bacteroidota bacterium]